MTLIWLIIGGVLGTVGLMGCIIPVIPGPIVTYCGLLCLIPTMHSPSVGTLSIYGGVTILVTALDYVVPALGAKRFNCSKFGTWGCVIGTLIGVFFFPVGLLLGPFCGAFVGELIARKPVRAAAFGGLGAFLGFLSGVCIKVVACVIMLVCYIRCL